MIEKLIHTNIFWNTYLFRRHNNKKIINTRLIVNKFLKKNLCEGCCDRITDNYFEPHMSADLEMINIVIYVNTKIQQKNYLYYSTFQN